MSDSNLTSHMSTITYRLVNQQSFSDIAFFFLAIINKVFSGPEQVTSVIMTFGGIQAKKTSPKQYAGFKKKNHNNNNNNNTYI